MDGWMRRYRLDVALSDGLRAAGVDEVGRGCLAGPVVAASVVLPLELAVYADLKDVMDSKQLKPGAREEMADRIRAKALAVGIGVASPEEIDRLNILQATQLAMKRSLDALHIHPELALVDGNRAFRHRVPVLPVVDGDARSLLIAAASVIAKVFRDRLMAKLDEGFPGYGFSDHVGYGTRAHLEALQRLGPSVIHRLSFAPVRACLGKTEMTRYGS
ncbi:ribonuclease HII [Alicyclobacillus mali]|uniref:Ribonuclease HII n=1 Tax=Alicyclobacillus mali (ex Roth et al. 2021) TaxID=1123961 RepID=A0ABS0F1T9_9BACL|nr:ribonuclease HII [Alicyclobacillus mali (ex Roth et al. 2021)]MBF8377265.1 ribonuclease HII [Alicyclobacillus mali (ex Roth et al. 2021)]MCL6488837.1 ribonuclease HII [Alicyclobacillus mali (ex Roth et al. 2021)]